MPGRRLSEREIADVRARRAEGIGEGVIAESFGISRATVSRYTAGDSRIVHRPRPELPAVTHLSVIDRPDAARPTTRQRQRAAFAEVAAGAWRADCMTDEEWTDWVQMNPTNLGGLGVADRPCTDCPLGFAAEMRGLGRCNGTPGWHPPADDHEEAQMGEQITVTNVRIEAPCGSCLHRDVCAIRASLGGLEAADVTLPKPDPALTVVTTLQVECSHYRRDGKGGSKTGRKLNLTDEERQRRADRIIAASAARRAEAVPA